MHNSTKKKKFKVAVIYHFWAHYREPIVSLMSKEKFPAPEYTIFSGIKSNGQQIKAINRAKAFISVELGGLRWRFLRNTWFGPSRIFLWQKGLLKLAWDKEFDTIIFLGVMYFISTWPAALIARLRGKHVLMWSHGFIRRDRGLKGWLRRLFYRLPNGMLLYGNWARRIMTEYGFDQNKLYVVFNSLDYDKQVNLRKKINENSIANTRSRLFKHADLPILIFIGRLTPQKKLRIVVDAAKSLIVAEKAFPVNVLFVGDGTERDDLKKSVNSAKLDEYFNFYGASYNEEELSTLIAAADLCVAPGEVGLTAMHALVYGTPVITHNDPTYQMPEFEAIIAGWNGDFFIRNDSDSLAKVIHKWCTNGLNRKMIRQQCYEVIEKYYNPHMQLKIINTAVRGQNKANEQLLNERYYAN